MTLPIPRRLVSRTRSQTLRGEHREKINNDCWVWFRFNLCFIMLHVRNKNAPSTDAEVDFPWRGFRKLLLLLLGYPWGHHHHLRTASPVSNGSTTHEWLTRHPPFRICTNFLATVNQTGYRDTRQQFWALWRMDAGQHVAAKKIFGADQKHSMSSQLGHWAWSRDVGNDEFPVPTLSEVVLLCIFSTHLDLCYSCRYLCMLACFRTMGRKRILLVPFFPEETRASFLVIF